MLGLPHYGAFDILVCQIPTIAPYKPEGGGVYIDRCITYLGPYLVIISFSSTARIHARLPHCYDHYAII